ncbi:MAG: MBL fold metallo-hydrolase [Planctomycetes bacterium]|nr:MBL fold metallo-hydrolase [Planctomycetota bacterium]
MFDSPTLQLLGGAGTVTGSKYLLKANGKQVLLDCGLFQGLKELRERNWHTPPFDAQDIDAVLLSHAHIDHCGYLPLLVRRGFHGPIYCTAGTADLLRIVLPDSAHLQEEEAAYANRHGFSKHRPALPLYTGVDAEATLKLVNAHSYGEGFTPIDGLRTVFRRAAHILGSASIDVQIEGERSFRLVFSGDLGRWDRPILRNPEPAPAADLLLVESTYGDRNHTKDPSQDLARIVNRVAEERGALLIPAFAVGRTQDMIWLLRQLEDAGKIPSLPVYIDSPMAINVGHLYCKHPEDHALDMKLLMDEKRCPLCCKEYHLARTPDESKALNQHPGPLIIVSASGMATGGRIVHHLKQRLPDPRTTVLFVGFQSIGTRGRTLQDRAKKVRIHGQDVPVRAKVETVSGLSSHADRSEILRWLQGFRTPPAETLIVHGEPLASMSLEGLIKKELGWQVRTPRDGEIVHLPGS